MRIISGEHQFVVQPRRHVQHLCELPRNGWLFHRALPGRGDEDRQALARGFDAVWWSRFPIGAEESIFNIAYQYDRYWDECFLGRRAISLCAVVRKKRS